MPQRHATPGDHKQTDAAEDGEREVDEQRGKERIPPVFQVADQGGEAQFGTELPEKRCVTWDRQTKNTASAGA